MRAAAAATLYRYAPDRPAARWVWLTPGSVAVTLLWLALTLGFGTYVANFGSYDATYGSLGAVIVLLTWLYLSAYILIMGAELNAELERQTTADTTEGAEQPIGTRGAQVTDTFVAPVPAPATGTRVATIAAIPSIGLIATVLTTTGLTLVRKRRTGAGIAAIVAATALSWMQRDDEHEDG